MADCTECRMPTYVEGICVDCLIHEHNRIDILEEYHEWVKANMEAEEDG